MALWYGRYDTLDSDKVKEAGFVDETERARWDAMSGCDVTVGYESEIPNDLMDIDGNPNYYYNTETEQIVHL